MDEMIGEQSAEIDMALWVHLYPLGLEWPGRARAISDLMILQRLAERAVPPGRRAEDLEKWRKWQSFLVA
jgi:hypothetical protein